MMEKFEILSYLCIVMIVIYLSYNGINNKLSNTTYSDILSIGLFVGFKQNKTQGWEYAEYKVYVGVHPVRRSLFRFISSEKIITYHFDSQAQEEYVEMNSQKLELNNKFQGYEDLFNYK